MQDPFTIEVDPAPAATFYSIEDDSITCEDLASYVPGIFRIQQWY